MSSRRMIASDIFEDDFVGSQSFFERLVWIGLFAVCADDQGRVIDNPAIIRAKVFPYDRNVDDSKVEAAMEQAAKAGKIIRYEAEGKRLLQIAQWWTYQTPSWASPSKFPAPKNWIDRVKYHTTGNKIVQRNWELQGGLPSELPSELPSGIEEDEVKGEVEGEGDVEAESKTAAAPAFVGGNYSQETTDERFAEAVYRQVTGNVSMPPSIRAHATEMILDLQAKHTKKDALIEYLKPYFARWRKTRGKTGRYYSALSPGWLEWALAGEMPGEDSTTLSGHKYVGGKYDEFIVR